MPPGALPYAAMTAEPLDPSGPNGRRIALVLLDSRDPDEEAVVVHGRTVLDGGSMRFELSGGARIDLPDSAVEELSPVTDEVRDLLGDAEFWVSLTVGAGPDELSPSVLITAGIPWPAPGR